MKNFTRPYRAQCRLRGHSCPGFCCRLFHWSGHATQYCPHSTGGRPLVCARGRAKTHPHTRALGRVSHRRRPIPWQLQHHRNIPRLLQHREKCYSYDKTSSLKHFTISGSATAHDCAGTGFSGNFMNWATSSSIDICALVSQAGIASKTPPAPPPSCSGP